MASLKTMTGSAGSFHKTAKLRISGQRKENGLFKKELTWLGYYINQEGVKPIKDKTEAITKLEAPKNVKG